MIEGKKVIIKILYRLKSSFRRQMKKGKIKKDIIKGIKY